MLQGNKATTMLLDVNGRKLEVSKTARNIAMFNFQQLFTKAMGAADYIAIASHFHTVFLVDVPIIKDTEFNWARRFITFIDSLYEHKVKLVCSAQEKPENLFVLSDSHSGVGAEESFAWKRCVSRLAEMQTVEYLSSPHKPDASN